MSIFEDLPRSEKGTWPEVAESEIIQTATEFTRLLDSVFERFTPEFDPESGVSSLELIKQKEDCSGFFAI